jgi:hypothetical protein
MSSSIDWVIVRGWGNKEIGAVGFIENKVGVVVAFYEDADGNKDGHVGKVEWAAFNLNPVSTKGANVVQVAMQARVDFDILERDPDFDSAA